MVCAYLLDERDLLRVGIVAAALPVLSFLVAIVTRSRITATHTIRPAQLTVGAAGTVELRLGNIGRSGSGALTIVDSPAEGLSGGVRATVPALPRGGAATVRYRLGASSRGRFTAGHVEVNQMGPLGLCVRRRTIPSDVDVIVAPRTIPLTGVPRSGGAAGGGGRAGGRSGDGDPDVRVRQYVPGDDVRTIHWRASARRDDLVVRMRQSGTRSAAAIVVDHRAGAHAGEAPDSSMEAAISLAASVAVHLLAHRLHVTLETHSGTVLVAEDAAGGTAAADRTLVGLAGLAPDEAGTLTCRIPNHVGLAVAVTGTLTARDVSSVVAARPTSCRGIAFVVDAASWPGAREDPRWLPADAAAHALVQGGWRAVVVRRGDDLGGAWLSALGGGIPTSRGSDGAGSDGAGSRNGGPDGGVLSGAVPSGAFASGGWAAP